MIPKKDRLTYSQAKMWAEVQKASGYLKDPRYRETKRSFASHTNHRGLISTDLILIASEVLKSIHG